MSGGKDIHGTDLSAFQQITSVEADPENPRVVLLFMTHEPSVTQMMSLRDHLLSWSPG